MRGRRRADGSCQAPSRSSPGAANVCSIRRRRQIDCRIHRAAAATSGRGAASVERVVAGAACRRTGAAGSYTLPLQGHSPKRAVAYRAHRSLRGGYGWQLFLQLQRVGETGPARHVSRAPQRAIHSRRRQGGNRRCCLRCDGRAVRHHCRAPYRPALRATDRRGRFAARATSDWMWQPRHRTSADVGSGPLQGGQRVPSPARMGRSRFVRRARPVSTRCGGDRHAQSHHRRIPLSVRVRPEHRHSAARSLAGRAELRVAGARIR